MQQFPLIVPDSCDFSYYVGFLCIKGNLVDVRVLDPAVQTAVLSRVDPQTCSLITFTKSSKGDFAVECFYNENRRAIINIWSSSGLLSRFLSQFVELCERNINISFLTQPSFEISCGCSNFVVCVLRELDEIGWSFVSNIDETFSSIEITIHDIADRLHQLRIQLDTHSLVSTCHGATVAFILPDFAWHVATEYTFGVTSRKSIDSATSVTERLETSSCVSSTPLPLHEWLQIGATSKEMSNIRLKNLFDKFQECLALCQPFWDVCDDFDKHCWSVEGITPISRATTIRRFHIGHHCFLSVKWETANARAYLSMILRFSGAPDIIRSLQHAQSNSPGALWNEAEYPRLNLQRWLGLSFVLPPSSDMAQHTTEQNRECPICYAYLVNDIAPDIVCANRQCRRNFHQHCLYIWLKSVPTSRQSFCTVFGICPFCSAPIRCNQVSDIMVK